MLTHVNFACVNLPRDVYGCQHPFVISDDAAPNRDAYHHGDLRNALVAASAELAESGGPDAVTVRAAARAVGVTATAAYRHFAGRDELIAAAKTQALASLFGSMQAFLKSLEPQEDPVQDAVAQMYAIGQGYVRFALAERGLFRTAFYGDEQVVTEAKELSGGDSAFEMLSRSLDDLVAVGFMDPRDRPEAEVAAWSMVHGLAMLLIDGPLRGLAEPARAVLIHRTLAASLRGFADGPNAEPVRSTDPHVTGEPLR